MMISFSLLKCLLYLPLFGVIILCVIPSKYPFFLKLLTLIIGGFSFLLSLMVWLNFDKSIGSFQFVTIITWIPFLNFNVVLGIDGISMFFLILTNLLVFICLLASWESIVENVKFYLVLFLLLQFFLIGVFCILDLFIFYIFFESVLIPMFLLIGIWGSRERKIKAAYYFFFSLF